MGVDLDDYGVIGELAEYRMQIAKEIVAAIDFYVQVQINKTD